MLTVNEEAPAASSVPSPVAQAASMEEGAAQTLLARVLRLEWLGQTVASLCWIGSVLTYGISSAGDWLQLFAASSWFLANVAAVVTAKAD